MSPLDIDRVLIHDYRVYQYHEVRSLKPFVPLHKT